MIRPVSIPAFFDCGFDPRFSKEGTVFFDDTPKTFYELCHHIANVIHRFFQRLLFSFLAYFSCSPKEREIRELILECADLERRWSSCTQTAFVFDNIGKIYDVYYLEHAFLEKISSLYQKLMQEKQKHRYPRDLLTVIHAIHKPQSNSWSQGRLKENEENLDLARLSLWGFWRLSRNFIDNEQLCKKYYIPHRLFIEKITPFAHALKTSMRRLRCCIQTCVQECSFFKIQAVLKEHLKEFDRSWKAYTHAHPLLKELQEIFEEQNTHEPYYKELYFHSLTPHEEYQRISADLYGSSNYRIDAALEQSQQALRKAFFQKFPHSSTTLLLKAKMFESATESATV